MAYSNWGAFVFCDGKRRRDCEDVPVFGDRSEETAVESGGRIWVNLLKLKAAGQLESSPWWQHAHHAVLGDGPVRLCGYKSGPELWVMRDGADAPAKVEIDWYDADYNRRTVSGEVGGCKWTASPGDDPERVELMLTEVDGKRWSATSGYEMGAGFDESDPDEEG